ncbi:hypothetical protein Pla175_16570 [Pirellulimonas nuda]|uniref:Uncharacterized protein n=1 Tax=Pirellulimonas nuda TaxID=2528009 RepID=A0A518DA10_9BACT|nr:hypothetical protein [Pirellulimonas nuda]QDU88283.1 hypothetical protein Pla175_16570 [Pirellulimonas nuda]
MRAVIVIAVIVLLMAAAGWITFSGGSDRPSMTVETDKIEQDIEAGKRALTGAVEKAEEADPAPATAPAVVPAESPSP